MQNLYEPQLSAGRRQSIASEQRAYRLGGYLHLNQRIERGYGFIQVAIKLPGLHHSCRRHSAKSPGPCRLSRSPYPSAEYIL
jgi:hypothetical protein